MKDSFPCRFFSLCAMAIVLLAGGCAASKPERLRILTYNIHHGEGDDKKVELERIARVIKSADADLVALQEVDKKTTRVAGVDETEELGRLTGLHAVFGSAMPYQGGEYGQAILSRRAIVSSNVISLPSGSEEPRIVLEAVVRLSDGKSLHFATTHLEHRVQDVRLGQAREVVAKLAPEAILAGDFNAVPGSPAMQVILDRWNDTTGRDELSFPADKPNRKIDWVLLPRQDAARYRVISAKVIDETVASDHRPVVVEIEIETPAPKPPG